MARKAKSTGRTGKRKSGRAKLSGGAVRDLELLRGKTRPVRGGAIGTQVMGRMNTGMGRMQPPGPLSQTPQKRL